MRNFPILIVSAVKLCINNVPHAWALVVVVVVVVERTD